MADEKDNLGADIEAAFNKLESGNESAQESTPAPEESGAAQPASQEAKQSEQKQIPEGGKPEQKAGAPTLGKDGKPLPPVKRFKAPGSWRPEYREKFGSLDPLIQEEIARREADMDRGLKAGSDARKFKDEFDKAVAPFQQFFAAENATPIQAMVNMFGAAARLRTDTPQNKAYLVANLINQFGVDIGLLDQILTQGIQNRQNPQANGGAGGQVHPQVINDAIRQQLGPMIEYVNNLRQREQGMMQTTSHELDQQIQDFASDANNEFFDDVREDMADILEMGANRGVKISLSEAYNRATLLHPTISQIVAQRKLSGQAAQLNAAAERAENAAVSVRSDTPSRSEEPKSNGSLRDDLLLAFDTVNRRAANR